MGKKTSEKTDDNLSEFKVGDHVKVNIACGSSIMDEQRKRAILFAPEWG
jgi:hypothetical protein